MINKCWQEVGRGRVKTVTDGDGGAWGRATTGYGDEVAPPAGIITSLKLAKYGWRERNDDDE